MQASPTPIAQDLTQQIQWIPVFVSLIGGGAFGAIITAVVTKYRSRQQPVSYSIEVIDIFKKSPTVPSLLAMLRMQEDEKTLGMVQVENLSVARIVLVNKGNQDIEQFKFGVTLGSDSVAVDVKVEVPDRHHTMEVLTALDLRNPKAEVDFLLKPFNRKNSYRATINLTYLKEPGEVKLSSPHSIRFVDASKEYLFLKIFAPKAVGLILPLIALLILLLAHELFDYFRILFK